MRWLIRGDYKGKAGETEKNGNKALKKKKKGETLGGDCGKNLYQIREERFEDMRKRGSKQKKILFFGLEVSIS